MMREIRRFFETEKRETRKTLLDYLEQTMLIFGTTLLAIAFVCWLVGGEAMEYSSMFALGSDGVPIHTVWQYLLSSACIAGLRLLFFSDAVIKKMSIVKRTIAMLIAVVVLIGIFAWIFDWFPVEELKFWLYFFVCFGISFAASVIASACKENMDNRRLEAGLKRLKEGQRQ